MQGRSGAKVGLGKRLAFGQPSADAGARRCAPGPRSKTDTETEMRKFLIATLALASLAACQTIAGAGRDMQNAGSAVTHEANKAQAKM